MKIQTKMQKKKTNKKHPWIAHNCIDPIHLSEGFGLVFKILSGWDLSVWPDMAIYISGCRTAAEPSPPIRTAGTGAGGSCVGNGSCLGLVTKPCAPVCSLAGSVQVSVSSTADTGGWQSNPSQVSQRQAAVRGWSHIPVQVRALSTPAGLVPTSIYLTLCQVFVLVLCLLCPPFVILLQTITVKGLQAETFWRKPNYFVQQVWKGSLTLSYYPFVLMTKDVL